jgi:hypothetical protein
MHLNNQLCAVQCTNASHTTTLVDAGSAQIATRELQLILGLTDITVTAKPNRVVHRAW